MKRKTSVQLLRLSLTAITLLLTFANLTAAPGSRSSSVGVAAAAAQGNIGVNGIFATDKAQRGRTVQAAVIMDIPSGLHVNANKPLGKYAVPTVLRIEAPNGLIVSPVNYPRAIVRRFSFSKDQLAVYEGRTVMRFNVTVPAGYGSGSAQLRARLRYQSCTNDVCYPPTTREVTMQIPVVNTNESIRRVNGQFFGGGRNKKG